MVPRRSARLAELDRELAAIPELLSERLDMPMWVRADSEGDYNATTAEIRGWQLMDKELFYGDDPRRDRIEICDLLTERMDMVCVKKLRGGASFSHLFSQGSVSATLYRIDAAYRERVHRELHTRWPAAPVRKPTIVYAIGVAWDGPLRTTLPLFSRVNLRNHAKTIRRADLDVALVRIVPTPFRDSPAVAVPAPAGHRGGAGPPLLRAVGQPPANGGRTSKLVAWATGALWSRTATSSRR